MKKSWSNPIRSARLSRRQLLQTMGAAGVTMATLPLVGRPARAAEQATYFTWGGYDDDGLFGPYIAKHGAPPNYATFGESEEALQKMRGGYVVDVSHPCNQSFPRWIESGLFQPIDTGKLSNWPDVLERLKNLQGAQQDGKQWFSPMEWGQTSITYRADLVELPDGQESWGILWDEKNAGKIGIIGSAGDAWWCAAIYAGVDFNDITDEEFEKVNELMRQQRPLVRMYSNDLTSMEQALASGELVAAMTWNESPVNLKSEGVNVKWANPKEGALTWVCGTMIHKDAPNLDLAHDVVDSLIAPDTGQYIIDSYGYGHCNRKAFDLVSQERLDELGLTRNPGDMLDAGHFQVPQSQEFETRLNTVFEEIMSGF